MHLSSCLSRRFLRSFFLCVLLGATALLTACSLSPAYVRPDMPLPETYKDFSEHEVPEPVAAIHAANREWWRNFHSPALILLQQHAVKHSYAFSAEKEVLAQALYRARQARADLLPSLDIGGSRSLSGRGAPGSYSKTDTVSGTAQASYEVDLWGANREEAAAATHRYISGLNAWRGAGLSLESEVALTYFSYLAAKENLEVYDEILVNAKEVLTYQRTREKFGAAAPLDVARQQSSVSGMEAGRMAYLVKMTEARNSLCQLIGMTSMPAEILEEITKEHLSAILPPTIQTGVPSELLMRRPDIAQAEANLQAANANIGIARAAFLPSITLTGSAGWQSDALAALISPAHALYSLTTSIMQPVFHNGRLLNEYKETVAAHRELMDRYREAVLGAFLEVATALESNRYLHEQELHRIRAGEEAEEAYRIARLRYEAGAEDFLAVLNAQETKLSADNQVVQSRLERLNTVVALFKALGGGWGDVPAPEDSL